MKRRNFVATIPVLAASLSSFTPLIANTVTNNASEEALLADFQAFFNAHLTAVASPERAIINKLSAPVSNPKFIDNKLTFKVKSGETVSLFHHKGKLKILFS